jgi:hypothetical protein
VTLGLLSLILWITPLKETYLRIRQADANWMGLAVASALMTLLMQALRWNVLLDLPESRLGQLIRLQFIGAAASFFLPSALSGDVVRSAMLAREKHLLERSILSAVLGRIFGLVSMLSLALIGALFWHHPGLRFQPGPTALVMAASGLACAGPAWYAWKRLRRNTDWWINGPTWRQRVFEGLSYLDQAVRNPILLSKAMALSMMLQVFTLFGGWCIFRAVGADLSLAAAFALQPLIQLGSIAPLSVGGIGVREGIGMTLFHGLAGLPRETCLAAIAMGYVSCTLISIPGLLLVGFEWQQGKRNRDITSQEV